MQLNAAKTIVCNGLCIIHCKSQAKLAKQCFILRPQLREAPGLKKITISIKDLILNFYLSSKITVLNQTLRPHYSLWIPASNKGDSRTSKWLQSSCPEWWCTHTHTERTQGCPWLCPSSPCSLTTSPPAPTSSLRLPGSEEGWPVLHKHTALPLQLIKTHPQDQNKTNEATELNSQLDKCKD